MKLYHQNSRFTTEEFMCPCGCVFGTVEEDINENLISTLNMMRTMYGKPMVVTSGARCEQYNAQIGGVPNSAHLPHPDTSQCRAVDIHVGNSHDRFDLLSIAHRLGITRIGIANTFIHLDVAWDLPDEVIFTYS